MFMRIDFLVRRTICTIYYTLFRWKAPMQLAIDRFSLPTFHLPPIDDISISKSISSVSPLPHLDRRAVGTTAVAAVTCRTIGHLLPVPPVLLEVLPSRYLALARSSIVDWM